MGEKGRQLYRCKCKTRYAWQYMGRMGLSRRLWGSVLGKTSRAESAIDLEFSDIECADTDRVAYCYSSAHGGAGDCIEKSESEDDASANFADAEFRMEY